MNRDDVADCADIDPFGEALASPGGADRRCLSRRPQPPAKAVHPTDRTSARRRSRR